MAKTATIDQTNNRANNQTTRIFFINPPETTEFGLPASSHEFSLFTNRQLYKALCQKESKRALPNQKERPKTKHVAPKNKHVASFYELEGAWRAWRLVLVPAAVCVCVCVCVRA